MKEKIRYWYECGLWSKTMLLHAVEKGVITVGDYTEITGEGL